MNGVGIEVNPLLVWWANILSKRDGTYKQVRFLTQNVFNYSVKDADYVYLFLMPDMIKKLVPKFKSDLKKGTIIISHGFKVIGFEKKLIYTEPDKAFSTFYYKM